MAIVDITAIASINRKQSEVQADFDLRGDRVRSISSGCGKSIALYESRKQETRKHPVTNDSLTYRRLFELEVRLLEKEGSGESGLFSQLIVR
ncbi:MAG: CRISPR-associated protein Cas1 [Oscillatoriales cyanobacterium]|nr:MAG: CRISPR-associated protein Cas1 [Oscillatoriales cyanobacterium]TAF17851.1 MAG: CRISPR-associated protein Cas1 [Oscillatoriales cyanobacterium]TAF26683.1 MAG: CRISPR-associated protein Cas1 [Oscillatoriales cyanobacterium]